MERCLHDQSAANQPITLLVTISGLQNCDFGCDRAIRPFGFHHFGRHSGALDTLTSAMVLCIYYVMSLPAVAIFWMNLTKVIFVARMDGNRRQGYWDGCTMCMLVRGYRGRKKQKNRSYRTVLQVGPISSPDNRAR